MLTGIAMVDAEREIEIDVVVAAPTDVVWQALTDNAAVRRWWAPGVVIDPEVGGAFVEPWVDASGRRLVTAGQIVELLPGVRLALTWADHGWPYTTFVEITLAPHREGAFVQLRHTGWEQWGADERATLVAAHRDGWEHHLAALAVFCEEQL